LYEDELDVMEVLSVMRAHTYSVVERMKDWRCSNHTCLFILSTNKKYNKKNSLPTKKVYSLSKKKKWSIHRKKKVV